jgi:hypothetical protein
MFSFTYPQDVFACPQDAFMYSRRYTYPRLKTSQLEYDDCAESGGQPPTQRVARALPPGVERLKRQADTFI